MRFVSLGGGNEVGASCYYVQIDGKGLLVDAGVRVSSPNEAGARVDTLPDLALLQELGGIEAVLVSHAHLDHIGSLPLVHRAFPSVPIFATAPTVHLMQVLLADALKIMAIKSEQEMECPLYSADLVSQMFTRVVSVPLGATVTVCEGIQANFFPAGHIMGAAMIGLEGNEGRVLFTGDISGGGQRTIPGMVTPKFRPHLMIMESTYGNRLHANRQREEKGLAEAVAEVIANGGHALIPAFALGRAQEVILLIQAYQQANRIPKFPIWVDGMVRSICDTYINFPDYLNGPVKRIINNGGNPFYREKATARPVTNAAQREKILAGAPSCIISSSGMLTGGPSQFYASRLVGDEKNAILLCGYQDEESPGHKMLSLVNEEDKKLTLGETVVTVNCRVDKYGLSAHADSGELAALAEKLKPRRVVLVHGDHGAREALSSALSASHPVYLSENGEMIEFTFKKKPAEKGEEPLAPQCLGKGRDLDPKELWEYLYKNHGDKQVYTVQDLAVLWYGQGVTPPEQELTAKLIKEDKYFVPDWKHPYFYRIKRADQVALYKKRIELMTGLKDKLPGHLVLIRDTNGAVRAGICFAAGENEFQAWKVGQKGTSHSPENLLEVIDRWAFSGKEPEPGEEKPKLHRLLLKAKTVFRKLKPQELWQCLKDEGAGAIHVSEILPLLNLTDLTVNRLALAWRLNTHPEVFERVAESPWQVSYRLLAGEPLLGETFKAEEPELMELLEQNAALGLLDQMLPPETGLYRKSIIREAGKIVLYFKFPKPAAAKYGKQLGDFSAETGWEIELNSEPHQGALLDLARSIVPEGWAVLKNPSLHKENKQVVIKCSIPASEDTAKFNEAARLFQEKTGFELVLAGDKSPAKVAENLSYRSKNETVPGERMEINTAFAIVKERLVDAGAVVYKASKKTDARGESVEVSFISPQIGEKYADILRALAAETGWPIKINPQPRQSEIIAYVRSLIPLEWGLRKEPGLFKERQEVQVKLVSPPEENSPLLEEIAAKIKAHTGYQLAVKKV